MNAKYLAILKLIVVGDSNVGKTNIISKYISSEFNKDHISTVGISMKTQAYYIDNIKVKEHIWDTVGSEKYKSVTGVYYKGAHGALIVFDITNKESFNNIEYWIESIQEQSKDIEIIIVGNKIDNEHKREITKKEIETFCKFKGKY